MNLAVELLSNTGYIMYNKALARVDVYKRQGLYLLPQFLFNDSRHTVLNHNSVLFAFGVTIPSSVRLCLGGAVNKAADVFFVFEQVKNGVFPERLASFCKISSAVQFVYDFSVTESPCE